MADFDLDTVLGYAVLTAPVNKYMTLLPRVLPQQLYTQTNNVLGDRYRRITFRGTRKSSKRARYGAPPKLVQRTGFGSEDMVMIHSIESIEVGNPNELQKLYRGYDNYEAVQGITAEFDRQGADFAVRQMNLVTTAIHSAIAYGKIGFDANDDITLNFGAAQEVVSLGIPAGNITAASVDWSDPTQNIVTWLQNFLSAARIATGWPLKYAICGKNVAGYIANNTAFREYLKYTGNGEYYTQTGRIRDGVLDMTWVFAQDTYFEDGAGTYTEIFPADQITFLPELTPDFYQLQYGSYLVPKEFAFVNAPMVSGQDIGQQLRDMLEQVYGPFRYAVGQMYPTPRLELTQGNTFIPDIKRPESMYIVDTKP